MATEKVTFEIDSNVDEVASSLNTLGVGAGGAASGLKKVALAAKALIATPLGAILAGVVAVLGPLISFLTKSQDGIEKVRVATAKVGAVFNVFRDRIIQVGNALFKFGEAAVKFFSGEFSAAAETAREATDLLTTSFDDLGKEIKEEIEIAGDMEKALISLEKAETDFLLSRAINFLQIQKLRLIAKDETAEIGERIAALRESIAIEQEVADKAIALQKKRLAQEFGLTDLSNERLQRILDEGIAIEELGLSISNEEDRARAIKEVVRLIELETESLRRQRTLVTELGTLQKKDFAEFKKDAKEKAGELKELEKVDPFDEQQEKQREANKDFLEGKSEEIKAIGKKSQAEKEAADKQLIIDKIQQQNREKSLQGIQAISQLGAQLAGKNAKLAAAFAITDAVINTYKAAARAIAEFTYPYNLVVAGLNIAAGFVQVRNIIKEAQKVGAGVPAGFEGASGGGVSVSAPGVETRFNSNLATDQAVDRNERQAALRGARDNQQVLPVTDYERVKNRVNVKEQGVTLGG